MSGIIKHFYDLCGGVLREYKVNFDAGNNLSTDLTPPNGASIITCPTNKKLVVFQITVGHSAANSIFLLYWGPGTNSTAFENSVSWTNVGLNTDHIIYTTPKIGPVSTNIYAACSLAANQPPVYIQYGITVE
jgi:hypothetical protein